MWSTKHKFQFLEWELVHETYYQISLECATMLFLLLPLVRPISELEVQLLENEFVNGYRDGDKVLYVLIMDDKWRVHEAMHKIYDNWDKQWQLTNDSFEMWLNTDVELVVFKGIFFECGNGVKRLVDGGVILSSL